CSGGLGLGLDQVKQETVGWPMGLEPTTTRITIWDSTN
ncbi:MAG: hypothetical protein RL083_253, partial [Pseudomonadota bacterium]